jgi:serine/threonine-protein kinase
MLALTAISRQALAAPPSREVRAAAVALFDEARALMAAGKHAEACPKLAESQRLDPGIGTLFNLSDCYERIGKTASAWIGFRDVAAEAVATGQPKREKVARERAAAIEPKLARLRIVVAQEAAVSGLEVTRDGVSVAQALWGTAVPLDPGAHAVVATAPGKKRWETTVMLDKPGVVSVEIPPLPADATSAPPQAGPQAAPRSPVAPPMTKEQPPAPAESPAGTWRAPLGIAVMGVGVAGLGVGAAFGFLAKSQFNASNADGHCDAEGFCDSTGLDLRDDAVTKGNIGTAVFVAGAVLTVGGAVLWLTAPSSPRVPAAPGLKAAGLYSRSAASMGASPSVGAGVTPGGLVIKGKY